MFYNDELSVALRLLIHFKTKLTIKILTLIQFYSIYIFDTRIQARLCPLIPVSLYIRPHIIQKILPSTSANCLPISSLPHSKYFLIVGSSFNFLFFSYILGHRKSYRVLFLVSFWVTTVWLLLSSTFEVLGVFP
jgi:hypothetical protein